MTQRRHWGVTVRMDEPQHIGYESAFDEDAPCDRPVPGDALQLEQCDACGATTYVVTDHNTVQCFGDERVESCGAEYRIYEADEDDLAW